MEANQTTIRAALLRSGEALRVALDAIISHRLRSALTVGGVVVGVAVVVLVAALLNGLQLSIKELTAAFAPEVIRVEKASFQDFAGDGQAFVEAESKRPDLLPDDLRFLRERWNASLEIGAQTDASLPVRRAAKTLAGVRIQGATANITSLTTVRVARGREIAEADDNFRRQVCVIGTDVADELFPNTDPLEKELRIGQLSYEVIGVAEPLGSAFGQSQDGFVMIPLGAFTKIFGERTRSLALFVRARQGTALSLAEVEELLRAGLRQRRRLRPGVDEDNFSVITAKSAQAFAATFTNIIGAALYPLTGVALIVAGVVVMNMMLVSVTERTREIGIRIAVGARRRDILTQFLTEATLLTIIGGAIGLGLAALLAWLARRATGIPVTPPLWSAAAAIIVSCVVGITFGVVPARRAARLDPIEALRSE